MTARQEERTGPSAATLTARLRLAQRAAVDSELVAHILGSPDAPWLGESIPSEDPSFRAFVCDLELHAGGSGPVLFRKAALVSFGEPRRDGSRWVIPIEWRAATMTALFPVFAGRLRIESDRIELDGRYAPPGGRLGYLLDGALLGAAARQTGRWFLRKLIAELAYPEGPRS